MQSSITTVLFDFGGVFTASPFAAVAEMAVELGYEPMDYAQAMFGTYHHDDDHPWHRLERGEISFEQCSQGVLQLGEQRGMRVDLIALLMKMGSEKIVHQPMVDVAREIKKAGLQIGIITNNVREFSDAWRQMIPVDEIVDQVFDSSFLGVRKPNPAIYQHALAAFACEPQQAVFLDDVIHNVEAARSLDIHGIWVEQDPLPAIAQLRRLLGW